MENEKETKNLECKGGIVSKEYTDRFNKDKKKTSKENIDPKEFIFTFPEDAAGDYLETIKHTLKAFKDNRILPQPLWVFPPETKEETYQEEKMKNNEYMKRREDIIERMFLVGCGTKEQAEEGFRLMEEMNELNKKYITRKK